MSLIRNITHIWILLLWYIMIVVKVIFMTSVNVVILMVTIILFHHLHYPFVPFIFFMFILITTMIISLIIVSKFNSSSVAIPRTLRAFYHLGLCHGLSCLCCATTIRRDMPRMVYPVLTIMTHYTCILYIYIYNSHPYNPCMLCKYRLLYVLRLTHVLVGLCNGTYLHTGTTVDDDLLPRQGHATRCNAWCFDYLMICYHCVDFLATNLIDWYLRYQPYSNYRWGSIGGYVSHVPAT